MYEINLSGKIEIEDPDSFMSDFQDLLNKHKITFNGQSAIFRLPDYVDFQKVESGDVQ